MNSNDFKQTVKAIYIKLVLFFALLVFVAIMLIIKITNPSFLNTQKEEVDVNQYVSTDGIDPNEIKNGIHLPTGFKEGNGLFEVVISCTPCHSAKLVTQNRATKEGWSSIIKWMQETQNLWDLGENESIIVNYLATHYAPENKGRRENLKDIDWYDLK